MGPFILNRDAHDVFEYFHSVIQDFFEKNLHIITIH